jgi:hypothetical protein
LRGQWLRSGDDVGRADRLATGGVGQVPIHLCFLKRFLALTADVRHRDDQHEEIAATTVQPRLRIAGIDSPCVVRRPSTRPVGRRVG